MLNFPCLSCPVNALCLLFKWSGFMINERLVWKFYVNMTTNDMFLWCVRVSYFSSFMDFVICWEVQQFVTITIISHSDNGARSPQRLGQRWKSKTRKTTGGPKILMVDLND